MIDVKLSRLLSDATVAERYHIALAFEYALKGINTMSALTPYEAAAVAAAEARWLLAENTLADYRLRHPALRVA